MREIDGVFVDENLLSVGRALSHVGEALYPGHPAVPELPLGALDPTILKVIGADGRDLILITRDNQMRRRRSQAALLRRARARAVFLTGKDEREPRENVLLILSHWDKISRLSSRLGSGPWAISLEPGRGPIRLSLPTTA